ncbi:YifB family Mg chelatase-like AAA ATPase [Curtobacterium ammoniigenes]|uniref:YifB family Mg chelatase-like AAA ATPase n=1 Tax=Curtobacterium ammoniigenes TaxID=395387 RepID=UPI00082FDD79|nr:YifB family Mg chelatase-like AAA ATPase [Curtobacterium ammoniigenes]
MSVIGRANCIALLGISGQLVEIEAHLSSQLPGFTLIGLPDTSLGEARERVRSAATTSGCPLPPRKITVNLTPATIPKHGSGFDLAIAIAVFRASGIVPSGAQQSVHLGELGLDGRVRPVTGVIPMLLAARSAGITRAVVPTACVAEAQVVSGIDIVGVASLRDAAIAEGAALTPVPVDPVAIEPDERASPGAHDDAELADVIGNPEAVRALVVAAAGGHHMLMVGSPGAGKTMLAERLPGLLPDLDAGAALELAAVRSVGGFGASSLTARPPLEAPHHSASSIALVGGGSGAIRPGSISMAHRGVLFLDEAPEFPRRVLDALRQPLESGEIVIHRSSGRARFPARFQLVLAANPCPCGNAGAGAGPAACACAPDAVRRYLGRLSGPLMDRVDIRIRVPRVTQARIAASGDASVSTGEARKRVADARARMRRRLAGTRWTQNSDVPGAWMRSGAMRLRPSVSRPLDEALERGSVSMRGWDRVARVAWTLADLGGADEPAADHLRGALALRQAIV